MAARLCRGDVLVAGATSPTTQVWAQANGQFRAQVSTGPVRMQRNRAWVATDATLTRKADGSVETIATPGDLVLSGAAGAGEHTLAAVGEGKQRTSMLWSGALPEPVLDGSTATYPDVKPDIDLVVTANLTGFEVNLVVKSQDAVASVQGIDFPIVSEAAASYTRDAAGNTKITDAKGKPFVSVPALEMWDASIDPGTKGHARKAMVATTAARRAPAGGHPAGLHLTIRPDLKWIRNPSTTYPVTIDPTINPLSTTFDTYVRQNDTVDRSGANDLQVGHLNDGTVARAFVDWDTSKLAYKQITAATLYFWNFWSGTCSARSWEVWKTGAAASGTMWATQPSWIAKEASSTSTKGYDSTCDDGFVTIDGKALFQDAANSGATRAHSGLRATSETDTSYFHQLRSRNWTTTSQLPYAVVTYNSIPQIGTRSTVPTSTCATGTSRPYISSATPQLKAVVSDADGQASTVNIEWWAVGGTAKIGSASLTNVASGSTATATVPSGAFANNGSYMWRVDATDGTGTSAWSSWCEFTVDTTVPSAAPTVSSTDYPAGTWAGAAGQAGTFTLGANGVTDIASYRYGLDQNPPTTTAPAATLGGTASVSITPSTNGPHTLYAQSVDRAGNLSPLTSYAFNVGSAAVTSPSEGTITAGLTQLQGSAPSGTTGVTYQWRRADTDSWSNIPTGDVSLSAGGGAVTWPLGQTDGSFATLNWNVKQTLTNANSPANLAGRWPLDDGRGTTAADNSGLGNPGTAASSVTWSGEHGGSAVFNGTTGAIATTNGVLDTTKSFTVAGWVKLNAKGTFQTMIGQDGSVDSGFELMYNPTADRWLFQRPTSDTTSPAWVAASSPGAPTTGVWTHLVGVFDASTGGLILYVNGAKTGTNTDTTPFAATGPLTIGRSKYNGSNSDWFNGSISDVQAYSRALTAAEISALYAGGSTAGGGQALAGPLQVRASFTGGSSGNTPPNHLTYDRDQATAQDSEAGPGSVNLVTGSFHVTDQDVSAHSYGSDLTVGRSFDSRQAAVFDTTHMFGPGWVSTATVQDAHAPYTGLSVAGSLVQVGLPDGSTVGFAASSSTGFTSQVGAEGLVLTYSAGTDSYTLSDTTGDVVNFTRVTGAPAGQYSPTTMTQPGNGQSTTLTWQTATVDGVTVTRPTQMLAPVPAGVTCASLVRGCRALTFTYPTTTTATGTAQAGWGDYSGRLQKISFTAWDPATSAMKTVVMSQYLYDSNGRLTAEWDPRVDNGTTHLWTTYAYNGDGTLATITPNTEPAWNLGYTTLPTDVGIGRLASVSRSALTAGTATTTVVYNVPLSGTGAPYDMSVVQTSRWDEQQAPVQATAVFDAGQVPDGNQAAGTLPTSWTRATITYLDANSRQVNMITPGGYTTTTWYDQWGNTVRTLTAGNRSRALAASTTDTATQEAAVADTLSTLNVYSSDGRTMTSSYGPMHDVQLAKGTTVQGRGHSSFTYDEGAQSPCPCQLQTTVKQSTAWWDASGVQHDDDTQTTSTGYDWTLRQPTSSTVDPGTSPHLNLVTRTEYDATTGLVTAITTPAGGTVDTTPSTRQTVYYRAGTGSGYTECDSHAEWANLPCRSQPGGQPATGPELPVSVTTYDIYVQPATITEKTSGGVLRTTTSTYDGAGRLATMAMTGSGASIPTRRNVYDPATGLLTNVQSLDSGGNVTAQTVTGYDALGRVSSYTDASNVQTTGTYDLFSRPATMTDGNDTRTYTYDQNGENRGVRTGVADGKAGTFSAGTYDADGHLVSETWPDGMVVTHTYDETGAEVGITYTKPGCGSATCVLYQDSAVPGSRGRIGTDNSSLVTRAFTYDQGGRVSSVQDTQDGTCITRSYGFDAATNRTSLTTYGPASDSTCQSTASSGSQTWNYDSASRSSGDTYDLLGRTTTIPAADTQNPDAGNLTVSYYVNDRTQTLTQNGLTATYNLDVDAQRIRSWTDGAGTVHTNHYSADRDERSWTDEGNATTTQSIEGLDGMAAIVTTRTGDTVAWQITNLHGDCVATINGGDQTLDSIILTDEYGVAGNAQQVGNVRYGWLGSGQRAADNPAGTILMGARLYNPTTGRFTTTDPLLGGNANPYDYCSGDSVNCSDMSGAWSTWHLTCRNSWVSHYYGWFTNGLNVHVRCEVGHGYWYTAFFVGLIVGAVVGGIVGSESGPGAAITAGIGAGLGAFLGGVGGWWYGTFCRHSDGAYVKANIYVRWWRRWTGLHGSWAWGYSWASCH